MSASGCSTYTPLAGSSWQSKLSSQAEPSTPIRSR
jgi:hypothetical protein